MVQPHAPTPARTMTETTTGTRPDPFDSLLGVEALLSMLADVERLSTAARSQRPSWRAAIGWARAD